MEAENNEENENKKKIVDNLYVNCHKAFRHLHLSLWWKTQEKRREEIHEGIFPYIYFPTSPLPPYSHSFMKMENSILLVMYLYFLAEIYSVLIAHVILLS